MTGEPMITGDALLLTTPVGSTHDSFSFRATGGRARVTGELKLVGSTIDGVDFVHAAVPVELAPWGRNPRLRAAQRRGEATPIATTSISLQLQLPPRHHLRPFQ